MTVEYFPKTEEERQEIEARQMMTLGFLGVAGVVPRLPAAIEKVEKEESHAG